MTSSQNISNLSHQTPARGNRRMKKGAYRVISYQVDLFDELLEVETF